MVKAVPVTLAPHPETLINTPVVKPFEIFLSVVNALLLSDATGNVVNFPSASS